MSIYLGPHYGKPPSGFFACVWCKLHNLFKFFINNFVLPFFIHFIYLSVIDFLFIKSFFKNTFVFCLKHGPFTSNHQKKIQHMVNQYLPKHIINTNYDKHLASPMC